MSKRKIKYTDEPIGELKVIEDFLQSPDQLIRNVDFDELLAKTHKAVKKAGITPKDLEIIIKEARRNKN